MLVDVNGLNENGLTLKDHMDLDNKYLIEDGGDFLDSLYFNVTLVRSGDRIKVKGTLHTAVSLRCVRCLENYEMQVNSSFDVILFPAGLIDVNNLHLDDEDMEYIFYEGDQIDMDKILFEQVNFFIPPNPLCRDDCRGLCPVCGVNLNREECKCDNSFKELSLLLDKIKR